MPSPQDQILEHFESNPHATFRMHDLRARFCPPAGSIHRENIKYAVGKLVYDGKVTKGGKDCYALANANLGLKVITTQDRIVDFIKASPTGTVLFAQLRKEMKLSSDDLLRHHLKRLEAKHLIEWDKHQIPCVYRLTKEAKTKKTPPIGTAFAVTVPPVDERTKSRLELIVERMMANPALFNETDILVTRKMFNV